MQLKVEAFTLVIDVIVERGPSSIDSTHFSSFFNDDDSANLVTCMQRAFFCNLSTVSVLAAWCRP